MAAGGRGGRAARGQRAGPRPGAVPRRRHHARCCSPPRCRTSASARCSTPWSTSRPPPHRACRRRRRAARSSTDPFSAFVFKVQAGMDTAHRDRLAFIRICSGVFERGMVVTHARTGRPFATKYAQHVFGRERESVDVAYPGDVVGLVNADGAAGSATPCSPSSRCSFPPLTTFAPEHFAVVPRPRTPPSTSSSAAASSSWTPRASSRCCAPTAAATRRRCSPSSARCSSRWPRTGWSTSSAPRCELERLPYSLALRTDAASAPGIAGRSRRRDPAADRRRAARAVHHKWGLRVLQQNKPQLTLEPLVAAQL